jgi:hypothetical protein
MAKLPIAPRRQERKTYPTPLSTDVLFAEMRDISREAIPAYGTAHPDATKWPLHKLVFVADASEDTGRENVYRFYYAADRPYQDRYNFEFTQADIGGTQFDAITRTYVNLRSGFDPVTPTMGTAMPDTPAGIGTALTVGSETGLTYVLAAREEVRIGEQELDSLYVVEKLTYVRKHQVISTETDARFGGTLVTTQILYYATETIPGTSPAVTASEAFSSPFSTGAQSLWAPTSGAFTYSGRQLSSWWYLVTATQQVPLALVGAGRSYTTAVDYHWPAVLAGIDIHAWVRRDGGGQPYVVPIYSHEAYSGPCKATILETWSLVAPTPVQPNIMLPLAIDISTPFVDIHIPPTLHYDFDLDLTPGNNHPVYEYGIDSYAYAETLPDTWPASIMAADTVEPYRGGYLRTILTVFEPTFTP